LILTFLANLNRQQQYIQSEEDKQDDIATSMGTTAKNLLNKAQRIHDIVKDDRKVCFLFHSILNFFFSFI
jgi:hypothetical protein